MAESDRNADRRETTWVPRLCEREAISALVKALRATLRHPEGSAVRRASRLELVRAVRKTLVHGPLAIRLGSDGPTLAGDRSEPAVSGRPASPFDLVLTDADPVRLADLVDRWSTLAEETAATPPPSGAPREPPAASKG